MKLLMGVIVLAVVSVTYAGDESLHPSPGIEKTKPQIEEPQYRNQISDSDKSPVTTVMAVSSINKEEAQTNTNQKNNDTNQSVDYAWWFSLLAIIVSGGAVVVGRMQYRVYKEQAGYMRDGLEMTKQSVEIARDELKIANRAYLFAGKWTVENLSVGVQARVKCSLPNTGHTPAILERRVGWVQVGKEKPPPLTPFALNTQPKEETPINAQGRASVIFETPHVIDVETYRALEGGDQTIYAGCCFVYRDVFDQRYWVVSSSQYKLKMQVFSVIEGREYNRHGVYREEEWQEGRVCIE